MASYHQRFLAGDHRAVWDELADLGDVPDPLADDVAAVARETMRRVARHVARIAEALDGLGHVPDNDRIPVHRPPTDADRVEVDRLDAEIGGLSAAFAAALREVGSVSFTGDCPALGLYYHARFPSDQGMPPGPGYPDPLVLPSVGYLDYNWEAHNEDGDAEGELVFPFAPDELHKTNVSGGTHDLYLPDRSADPVLYYVAGRDGITLVQYLRVSIAWGGFPGWSFAPDQAPAALAGLRAEPDF
jgi:hypothetical protein